MASKDEQGIYHLNGTSHSRKYEGDTYEVISQLESAVYDVTCKLRNGHAKQESQSDIA